MIFLFSATGNSRWAATILSQATHEETVNIAGALAGDCVYTLRNHERLGFVFPVHGWRVPTIVRRFIAKLVIQADYLPYCYAVCTAGDDIGTTIEEYLNGALAANKSLREIGVTQADSAWSLLMPESYVGLPFMDVDTKEDERRKISQSRQRLQVICEEIHDNKKGVFRLDRGRWPRINSHLLGAFFERFLITDKPFAFDARKCTRCGLCAKVCPTHNLKGGRNRSPRWKHDGSCISCFNCYHRCPTHAIRYGHRTKHKGQYYFHE